MKITPRPVAPATASLPDTIDEQPLVEPALPALAKPLAAPSEAIASALRGATPIAALSAEDDARLHAALIACVAGDPGEVEPLLADPAAVQEIFALHTSCIADELSAPERVVFDARASALLAQLLRP